MKKNEGMCAWGGGAVGLALVALMGPGCDRPNEAAPGGAPSSSAAVPPSAVAAGSASAAALDPDDPGTCAACHAAVVDEWRGSMHAQAHHSRDPIYGALRRFRIAKEGEALGAKCAGCHHPRELAELEGPRAVQGVGCASCHAIGGVDLDGGKAGAAALLAGTPGVLRGPHDVAASAAAPHGVGAALPALSDGKTICLACHQAEQNKAGVPTCSTGIESSKSAEPAACTACHMPEVEGRSGAASTREKHRSHAFLGPHLAWQKGDPSFVAAGVEIDGELQGEVGRVRLKNVTGHGFPTGFPGRMAVVVLRGLDAGGKELWRNFRDDPMKEAPEAVLNKVYVDDDGKPVLPPYGKKLARDTRLAPDEVRELVVTLPEGVAKLEVELRMWLLPPKAAETVGVADAPEAKPLKVAGATIARP